MLPVTCFGHTDIRSRTIFAVSGDVQMDSYLIQVNTGMGKTPVSFVVPLNKIQPVSRCEMEHTSVSDVRYLDSEQHTSLWCYSVRAMDHI